MNINDTIWVKLTGDGLRVYRAHFERLGLPPDEYVNNAERHARLGWWQFQLWELMQVFGPSTLMGGPQLIKNNEIRLDEPEA